MSKTILQSTPPENRKLSLLGRLRTRSAKKRGQPLDRLDNAKLTTRGEVEARSSEKPAVTPTPPPPKKKNPDTYRKRSKLPFWEEKVLTKPPTAREAAFGGPPRYDWIDIVSKDLNGWIMCGSDSRIPGHRHGENGGKSIVGRPCLIPVPSS
jgi:hypothetical protein